MEQIFKLMDALKKFKGSKDETELSKQFFDIAQAAFSGYISVNKHTKEEFSIHLYNIEFYYHDEDDDGIKDYIKYHRDDKGYKNLWHANGAFVPHISGVDVAFENENKRFRGSFLMRGYAILDKRAAKKVYFNDEHPQYLWDDLFGYANKTIHGTPNIRWQNAKLPFTGEIMTNVRKNIYVKDEKGNDVLINGKRIVDDRLWAYSRDKEQLSQYLNDSL